MMMTERDRMVMQRYSRTQRREVLECIALLLMYFLTIGFALWCGYQAYMDGV